MFIGNAWSTFLALKTGLAVYFQERDDGTTEYDVFAVKCEPIDGGILDESLEDGFTFDGGVLRDLVPEHFLRGVTSCGDDFVDFVLKDELADAARQWVESHGADETVLEQIQQKALRRTGQWVAVRNPLRSDYYDKAITQRYARGAQEASAEGRCY